MGNSPFIFIKCLELFMQGMLVYIIRNRQQCLCLCLSYMYGICCSPRELSEAAWIWYLCFDSYHSNYLAQEAEDLIE